MSRNRMVVGEEERLPSFVISQPFIKAANTDSPSPSVEDVADFMRSEGFMPIPASYFGWIRAGDGMAVVDAKQDNFILTEDGVVPIDLQMAQLADAVGVEIAKVPENQSPEPGEGNSPVGTSQGCSLSMPTASEIKRFGR